MTALDLDTIEQLDFEHVEPCQAPPECDVVARWARTAHCANPECPDQTLYFCEQHAAWIKVQDARRRRTEGACSWCGDESFDTTWRRL